MDMKFQTRRPSSPDEQQSQRDTPKKHGALPEDIRNYGVDKLASSHEEQRTRMLESLRRVAEKETDAPYGTDTSKYKVAKDASGNWEIQDGSGAWVAGPFGKDWGKATRKLSELRKKTHSPASQPSGEAVRSSVIERELGAFFVEPPSIFPAAYWALNGVDEEVRIIAKRPVRETFRGALSRMQERYAGSGENYLTALEEMLMELEHAEAPHVGKPSTDSNTEAMLRAVFTSNHCRALIAAAKGESSIIAKELRRQLEERRLDACRRTQALRVVSKVTPDPQSVSSLAYVIRRCIPTWILRAFARSEEVRAALGILDEIQCLYDFSKKSFVDPYPAIKICLERQILEDQAKFLRTIHSGMAVTNNPPREWVWSTLSNIAADQLESGRHHLTRGALHPLGPGNALLCLYDTATNELVQMGALDLNRARRDKELLLLNIYSAE